MVFKKGQSGNPGGVAMKPETIARRQVLRDIREFCKMHSQDAVEALVEVMNTKTAPPAARVAAANSILDRGWGKASLEVNATVTTYDNMSDTELVKIITGNVIEGEVLRVIEENEREEREMLEEAEDEE